MDFVSSVILDKHGKHETFDHILQETTPSVINWQDYEGRTALHLAVADGNDAVVKALVSCVVIS